MSEDAPPGITWKTVRHHVMPVKDLREHSFVNCWCRPVYDEGLTIHNSMDGRELYETGERKLS